MCGHVFLVHGHLDKLACDAWLVPSGSFPVPGTGWRHAVASDPPPDTPARWADVTGRVIPWQPLHPEYPRPWVVRTANRSDAAADDFVEPARQFLATAAEALSPNPKNGRKLPLLALPVTGAGFAGGARQAGAIVKRLLPEIYQFVEKHSIDVALVMKDAAQYAAAQAVRAELLGDQAWPNLDEQLLGQVNRLAELAVRQELVLFLGAGVSQAAGLPSWGKLLENLASEELAADQDFKMLAAVDQARVLEKLLVLPRTLGEAVAEQVRGKHYSLVHGLLAALPVQEVITTNYDDLFETASAAANREACVLPYNQAGGGRRWLLKLHGCVSHPEDIVLTRKDYLRYDAERAALAGLVQGLLITHHVLFVGFSLSDDNFHRIADAVRRVSKERFGTSLAVAANRLLKEVWEADLNWVEFGELPDSARNLEIFLDRLAARTVSSANHLFDTKYEATLTPSELDLRGQLEALASFFTATPATERQGVAWVELERFLGRVGCPLKGNARSAMPGDDRQPRVPANNRMMPTLIATPTRVEAAGNQPKLIEEYIGRVNSGHSRTSIAHMRSPGGWVEPGQTPEFEEFTIVLKGMLRVTHADGILDVREGQAVIAHAGEWVQYSTPEADGAEYIAVCLPAFSPSTVHRETETAS